MAAGRKFSVWYWVMTVAVTVALLAPATLVASSSEKTSAGDAIFNTLEMCQGEDSTNPDYW